MLVGVGWQDGIKNNGGLRNSRAYPWPSFVWRVLKPSMSVAEIEVGCVMRKGPGRYDTWFRVICIWNLRQNKSKIAEALWYVHSRSDFYDFNYCYFQTFIASITLFGEWSGQKCLKLKMDKICRPGPFCMTRPKCQSKEKKNKKNETCEQVLYFLFLIEKHSQTASIAWNHDVGCNNFTTWEQVCYCLQQRQYCLYLLNEAVKSIKYLVTYLA